MRQGLITSMCGDGGNDSGALRTAHLGMALSSATSATVVAPFTTRVPSISPLADLLREGRGALATNFAGYKYCVHYGLPSCALLSRPWSVGSLLGRFGPLSTESGPNSCRPGPNVAILRRCQTNDVESWGRTWLSSNLAWSWCFRLGV